MSNSQEQEALARQLCAIYIEAQGFSNPAKWEDLDSITRTAWIMVAQFVEAREHEPIATEQDPIVRVEHVQVNKRFVDYEGIVHERLRDFYNPDHK